MSEYTDLRDQLNRARANRESAADTLAGALTRLKRIARERATHDRVFDRRDPAAVGERERLAKRERELGAEVERARAALGIARRLEADVAGTFSRFSDPTTNIGRLDDRTPILLMPVRLETRFKTGSHGGGPQDQLWIRIYPDDCWVDTFEAQLTESEVTNAQAYWVNIWKAGGIEDQQRGAWRGLVSAQGSGRARWIVSQYQPVNIGAAPTKARPQDVILTIATQTPMAGADLAAATTYWQAVWLADRAATGVSAARAALDAAVGKARSAEIVRDYQPENLDATLAPGFTKAQVNVSVAVVVFPAVDTKESAWTQAPRVTCLPERFVFIGYRGENPPVVVVGAPVPPTLVIGPDPSALEADQLKHDADGNLVLPADLSWIADFDRAVANGMGFRIPLTDAQARDGFDRVLVLGVRLGADAQASQKELETLFQHHASSRKGLAMVPQGTATNNVEGAPAGLARLDDADESFDASGAPLFAADANWLDKRDGQWLAEYLGLAPGIFWRTHGADTTDQATARAMNEALWPATLGYWMETMMAPVFGRDAVDETRAFFNRYVVGAGSVPAFRIGTQPYGVLPASAFSRLAWFHEANEPDRIAAAFARRRPANLFLARLHVLLMAMSEDWTAAAGGVSFVGRTGDPHALLLDILGLHPGSVEWSQRYADSFEMLFNRLNLMGIGGRIGAILLASQREAARAKLQELSGGTSAALPLLDKVLASHHHELRGGVVDDRPLSEVDRIRAYTTGGANYVQWLIDAANESLDALYAQDEFVNDSPPSALLYLLLRHALQLGYHDTSISLHELAGLYTAEAAIVARQDDPFIHVRDTTARSESRYESLYAIAQPITGSATTPVHRFIATQLSVLSSAIGLRDQLDAMERLKDESTARLERAFADHVDCCSYRLDAWILGIVGYQLALMRNLHDGQQETAVQGIHLGGYAILEDVRPEHKQLSAVEIADPDVAADFESDLPLMRDSANQGYIHTPSSNHAVAAAVLRNGFISDSSPANRETMAVNLTSERVRTALGLIEGIRGGQGLGDLLGYQFERGLHDRHELAEVDKFIFKLRKAFPLRADRLTETRTEEGMPIESIEARNVIDGLALAEHIKGTGKRSYPFGKTGFIPATPAEAAAIDAEADRLLESHDAVADLALAEGVYQAVVGNYDRVASTYDAYARGNFPPEPDIVRTPASGIGITHRAALHLEPGLSSAMSPIAGISMTPRAQAEPAVNRWLAGILPSPSQVGCTITFRDAAAGTWATREVTLDELDLQPADIVAIFQDGNQQAMNELDDRIVRHAVLTFGPRPDVAPSIAYMEKVAAPYSVFELLPLVRSVRRLLTRARPLRPTDASLRNEARTKQDVEQTIDKARLDLVRAALTMLKADADALATTLGGPLSDLTNRRGEILANVDDYVRDVTALLSRAARFVMPQAGWGFAYDFQRRTFAAILDQAAARVVAWDAKLAEFTRWLDDEAMMPATASDAERFVMLQKAERTLSTTSTTPPPATPALYRTALITVLQPAFEAKRGQLDGLRLTTRTRVADLLSDVTAVLPVTAFDADAYSVAEHADQMVRFSEDAVAVLNVVSRECTRRLDASQARYDVHDAAASSTDKRQALEAAAKALLGEDFVVVPEFTLDPEVGDELDNAVQQSVSGALFTYLTTPQALNTEPLEDFPVDTWLYGVARVREQMRAWEQIVMLAGSLGRAEPALVPTQLPFVPDDQWVGLEFPPAQALDHDRLLYTAHFSAPYAKGARQCGLLLDEWTETIPGRDVHTGIAFHHDRPNNEAPQTMLLVTPTDFRGAWQWDDVVDALNETLALAKLRAVEPRQIDATPYAWFLPATIMASQVSQLTIAANLALNNRVVDAIGRV